MGQVDSLLAQSKGLIVPNLNSIVIDVFCFGHSNPRIDGIEWERWATMTADKSLSNQSPQDLREGKVLEGPFWNERVRVVSVKKIGASMELQVVGLKTDTFYPRVLTESDLSKIRILDLKERDFSGDSERFFLGIEAHRIRFAHQFDPLYAVNVSQIDPLPHQIEAVYHYILKHPRVRFLLADDPGAGKTIMAGLVLKELKQRGLVERTLIVVPGHLSEQWLRELKEKFGERFRVIERAIMDASWGRNVWSDESQAITSMDFAKQEDVMLSLAEAKWDLVIVDEAHKMSAYQYGDKLSKTQRYRLGELLSKNTDFLIFLTATPHRGDPENFRLFLDLLEPGFFATTEMLEESINNKDNPLFLRRLKEDLKGFDGAPLFPPRQVQTVKYRLSDDEKILYNAVTQYVEKYYCKAMEKAKRNAAFALIILQRRIASSIGAIRRSLENRRNRLQELYKTGQLVKEQGYIDMEMLEDLPEAERWRKEEELLERLTSADTLDELKDEIEKLEELVKLAKEAERKEVETKLVQLRQLMETEKLRKSGVKMLIFTEWKDTLDYLAQKIKGWGYSVCLIHGNMNLDKRIQAENEFKHEAQIMVSTEAGGEGINLQFCWLMVNYDIPWNPNRLEQRMGRIHRYGQQYEVHIYNLVAIDTKEGKVLSKLFDKLETIRTQLGSDRVFDVLGDMIPGKSLEDLIVEAITNKRSMEEILKDFDRITDEEAIRKLKEATIEGLATRHIDLTKILGETREAKENRLVPEYIEKFFLKAAEKFGIKVEKRADGLYRIPSVPYDMRRISFEFKTKYGEPYREYSKLSFVKEEAFRKQAEFIAPAHPLLEAVVERIFEDYSIDLEGGAVFEDPSGYIDGLVWFIQCEINDGNGRTAGRRIYAVHQSSSGETKTVSPSFLWDLKPSSKDSLYRFSEQPVEEKVMAYAIENVVPKYLDELKAQRQHDAEIKRKYGLKSLEYLIGESEAKLIDYEVRRSRGESIPDPNIQKEQRNKEDNVRKKKQLERQIEAETHLLPSPPKILGVAAVVPKPSVDELKRDEQVEQIGMEVVMTFERSQGRTPDDVSTHNLGFDVKSSDQAETRYIEVKARAREGKIALTPNEWLMAHRLDNEYWLYIVTNVASHPELYLLQNPASKLKPSEEIETVRYVIDNWKDHANKTEVAACHDEKGIHRS